MAEETITRRKICDLFLNGKCLDFPSKVQEVQRFLEDNGAAVPTSDYITTFLKNWNRRWMQYGRNRSGLVRKSEEWLNQPFHTPDLEVACSRKRSSFQELSYSQKMRRTTDLRQAEPEQLSFAASSSFRKDGNLEAAQLLKIIADAPKECSAILRTWTKEELTSNKMSAEMALATSADCKLSKHQYEVLSKNCKGIGADIFPCYSKLQKAKTHCYPEGVIVTEQEAVVGLQNLVDHTASRLLSTLEPISANEITILYKWGFDGSTGHAEFRQAFQDTTTTDSSVVITALVPVQVIDNKKALLWQNQNCSSTRYCRPIRIAYEKESVETIQREYKRVEAEIAQLVTTAVKLNNGTITTHHHLFMTMIDGKIINVLTENKATSRCYICKCGPKEMNNLGNIETTLAPQNIIDLKYGISPLHARIKFFEFLLHLSYRLQLPVDSRKKGNHKTVEEKQLLAEAKSAIQKKFREKLGLIVDTPKPGFGSSNNGNTARKFFENFEISADITGIDKALIYRFAVILSAINTSKDVDATKFHTFARETAEILVAKYSFWYMSPTVHKVLMHGRDIISHAILPLGMLSEEAQEHCNKDFKLFRSQYARRNSRIANLTDIFNRFLVMSDPVTSNLRSPNKLSKKSCDLPLELINMLK